MCKILILGLALMTNLNALPAVQRTAPRLALATRTLATRESALNMLQTIAPHSKSAVHLAISNNLSRIAADQGQNKSNFNLRILTNVSDVVHISLKLWVRMLPEGTGAPIHG